MIKRFFVMALSFMCMSINPVSAQQNSPYLLDKLNNYYGGADRSQLKQEAKWKQDVKLQRYLNYYFLNKPVYLTPAMMDRLAKSGYLDQDPEKQQFVIGFFSVIFQDNPGLFVQWLDRANLTQYQSGAFIRAARFAGLGERTKKWALGKQDWSYTDESDFSDLASVYENPIKSPSDIQRFWGAYLADGNNKYLDKLINVMKESDVELDKAEINKGNYESFRQKTLNEVIEGLFINAGIQYKNVDTYLRSLRKTSDNPQLRRIIVAIDNQKNKQ